MGNILINFGEFDKSESFESLIHLFNIFLVDVFDKDWKDKVFKFNFISDRTIDINKFINKKRDYTEENIIFNFNREILNAKLYSFRIYSDKKSKIIKFEIPNIKFYKTTGLKKAFNRYLNLAENLENGCILYEM